MANKMIIGDKVILEEIDYENIEQLRQWRNMPELRRWFREYKDITKLKQDMWYKEKGSNNSTRHIYFQIMAKQMPCDPVFGEEKQIRDRRLIGCCGGHYWNKLLRSIEFGIFLAPSFQGCGFGKEALCLLLKYMFENLNVHKVWAEVFTGNNALELYKKIGFKEDGILRDNCFKEGKYFDSTIISMLENEWKELRDKGVL